MRLRSVALILLASLAASCQKGTRDEQDEQKSGGGSASASGHGSASASGTGGDTLKPGAPDAGAPASTDRDLDSKDILARTKVSTAATVKHVLISWKDLARAFRGQQDPRGAGRDNAAAADLAEQVAAKLKADPSQIDAMIQANSEDPGSLSGDPYEVTADSGLVEPFKNLALRLEINEVGIVKTVYGYHVMLRIQPPPPDPVESAEILARPPNKTEVTVQHILIGWKDTPAAKAGKATPEALKRDKAAADKLALEVFAKVTKGGDMKALMKQYSEDPGSAATGESYPVSPDAQLVEPFKNLSLRLRMDEAGIVKTVYGWHIIKRIAPPPPPKPVIDDKLDSADILNRDPVTESAEVKHILLGWKEVSTGKPPGSERSRADLEQLVAKTMQRIKDGEKFDALMDELSEDGQFGQPKGGKTYPVTPSAGLVQPFKDLSLRLNVNEVGAVKSQFGIHIIQRVK